MSEAQRKALRASCAAMSMNGLDAAATEIQDLLDQEAAIAANLSLLEEGLRPGDVVRLLTGEEMKCLEGSAKSCYVAGMNMGWPVARAIIRALVAGGQASIVRKGSDE